MMDNKGFAIGGCFLGTFGITTHMDTVSTAKRSAMMRLVKWKNTKPEMVVCRLLHADGYRLQVNFSWSDQHEQTRLYESKSL